MDTLFGIPLPQQDDDEETTDVIIRLPKETANTKLGKTKLITILKHMGAEVVEETSGTRDVPIADDVREVLEYHAEVMAEHFPRGLDYTVPWRRDLVRARLRRFTVDELKQSIDFTARSPFHLCLPGSGNDTGKKYLDFDHIMGNYKKVERKLEGGEKMTQNANEVDQLRLTLRRLGENLRAGSAGLAETEQFQATVGRLKELTGENYLWKEDRFVQ